MASNRSGQSIPPNSAAISQENPLQALENIASHLRESNYELRGMNTDCSVLSLNPNMSPQQHERSIQHLLGLAPPYMSSQSQKMNNPQLASKDKDIFSHSYNSIIKMEDELEDDTEINSLLAPNLNRNSQSKTNRSTYRTHPPSQSVRDYTNSQQNILHPNTNPQTQEKDIQNEHIKIRESEEYASIHEQLRKDNGTPQLQLQMSPQYEVINTFEPSASRNRSSGLTHSSSCNHYSHNLMTSNAPLLEGHPFSSVSSHRSTTASPPQPNNLNNMNMNMNLNTEAGSTERQTNRSNPGQQSIMSTTRSNTQQDQSLKLFRELETHMTTLHSLKAQLQYTVSGNEIKGATNPEQQFRELKSSMYSNIQDQLDQRVNKIGTQKKSFYTKANDLHQQITEAQELIMKVIEKSDAPISSQTSIDVEFHLNQIRMKIGKIRLQINKLINSQAEDQDNLQLELTPKKEMSHLKSENNNLKREIFKLNQTINQIETKLMNKNDDLPQQMSNFEDKENVDRNVQLSSIQQVDEKILSQINSELNELQDQRSKRNDNMKKNLSGMNLKQPSLDYRNLGNSSIRYSQREKEEKSRLTEALVEAPLRDEMLRTKLKYLIKIIKAYADSISANKSKMSELKSILLSTDPSSSMIDPAPHSISTTYLKELEEKTTNDLIDEMETTIHDLIKKIDEKNKTREDTLSNILAHIKHSNLKNFVKLQSEHNSKLTELTHEMRAKTDETEKEKLVAISHRNALIQEKLNNEDKESHIFLLQSNIQRLNNQIALLTQENGQLLSRLKDAELSTSQLLQEQNTQKSQKIQEMLEKQEELISKAKEEGKKEGIQLINQKNEFLEKENKSFREKVYQLERDISELAKYKDDFNQLEKNKINQIEERSQNKLKYIQKMHQEQLDQMRVALQQAQSDYQTKIEAFQDQIDARVAKAKMEAKKEEEQSRKEYIEKLAQLRLDEAKYGKQSQNISLTKINKELKLVISEIEKMSGTAVKKSKNEFSQSFIKSDIKQIHSQLLGIQKMILKFKDEGGFAEGPLTPIGQRDKIGYSMLEDDEKKELMDTDPMVLSFPPQLTSAFKKVRLDDSLENELTQKQSASETSFIKNSFQNEYEIEKSKGNYIPVSKQKQEVSFEHEDTQCSLEKSLPPLDYRVCVRCGKNDASSPNSCVFHPYKCKGGTEFVYSEAWHKCRERCVDSMPGCYKHNAHKYPTNVPYKSRGKTNRLSKQTESVFKNKIYEDEINSLNQMIGKNSVKSSHISIGINTEKINIPTKDILKVSLLEKSSDDFIKKGKKISPIQIKEEVKVEESKSMRYNKFNYVNSPLHEITSQNRNISEKQTVDKSKRLEYSPGAKRYKEEKERIKESIRDLKERMNKLSNNSTFVNKNNNSTITGAQILYSEETLMEKDLAKIHPNIEVVSPDLKTPTPYSHSQKLVSPISDQHQHFMDTNDSPKVKYPQGQDPYSTSKNPFERYLSPRGIDNIQEVIEEYEQTFRPKEDQSPLHY